jgi:hypothetical protein
MHGFAPFMVLVAAYGGSRLLYGGVYMIGDTAKEFIT